MWLARRDVRFATCPITEGSLIRFLIRQGQDGTTARAVVATLAEHPRREFWPDSFSDRDVPLERLVGHRPVTVAYLAQLAREYHGTLASFDRGLAGLHGDIVELIPTG